MILDLTRSIEFVLIGIVFLQCEHSAHRLVASSLHQFPYDTQFFSPLMHSKVINVQDGHSSPKYQYEVGDDHNHTNKGLELE